ncbi:MAG: hypothetical protein DDT41_01437 [candidate division WS2 bacterium]|nr:hypothetical protein [Candidatus Psychracetigena formicireducens]
MTVTYNLANNIGQVRLITGDNILAKAVFTDAEITYFLTANNNSINLASASVLEAWAAKHGTSMEREEIGDYSFTQKIVSNMLELAKNLREKESLTPTVAIASFDLANGGR